MDVWEVPAFGFWEAYEYVMLFLLFGCSSDFFRFSHFGRNVRVVACLGSYTSFFFFNAEDSYDEMDYLWIEIEMWFLVSRVVVLFCSTGCHFFQV